MVFSITDLDGDGQLSFEEFVLAAILLGTFSQDQILFIMFEIFDGNGNNFIDHKEFAHLTDAVEELAGNMFPGNYSTFCEQFDRDGDGLIDFGEFLGINQHFPMVFFPVRARLRKRIACTLSLCFSQFYEKFRRDMDSSRILTLN